MNWKEELKEIIGTGTGCSDSVIEDFVYKHPEIHGKDIWDYVSDIDAPDGCKGCEFVQNIGFSSPCTSCSRVIKVKDFYKSR